MMIKIASLKRSVKGTEICQLCILVWGLQRLFPCVTFLTRSVRLHPVCIRLAWHWILIPMEKDYVIFTGTEIDYPFWSGRRVLRVSFCRCWRRAECSWESSTRITEHEQQLWLELSFHFPFVSVVRICCLWGLASLSRNGGVVCNGTSFRSLSINELFERPRRKYRRTFGITSHLKRSDFTLFLTAHYKVKDFAWYFDK